MAFLPYPKSVSSNIMTRPLPRQARPRMTGGLTSADLDRAQTPHLDNGEYISQRCGMRFTWDPAKNAANVRRHGIAFQDAARVFDGPTVERTDDRFDYGEARIYAIGLVNGIEITVIYTDRDPDERHIKSAWRSEPHERRYYWNHLED